MIEKLQTRIDYYKSKSNREKFLFAIEPSLEIGMRDFIVKSNDEDLSIYELEGFDAELLVATIKEQSLLNDNDIEKIEDILKAVGHVRSLETARAIHKKYGTIPEIVKEREKTLSEADEFLKETEEIIQLMRDKV